MNAVLMLSLLATGAHLENLRSDAKIPINLDISREIPDKVALLRVDYNVDIHWYSIKPEYEADYKIGDVICNGELILENYDWTLDRSVFFVPFVDNSLYVEVINTWKNGKGETVKEVEEFLKRAGDPCYDTVKRRPIELDIQMEEDTEFVEMETPQENVTKFILKDAFKFELVIGMVRYGHYILDDRTKGIMHKRALLNETTTPPTLDIFMYTNTGVMITAHYEYVGGENGFRFVNEDIEDMF